MAAVAVCVLATYSVYASTGIARAATVTPHEDQTMTSVAFKGQPVQLAGHFPRLGTAAPDFRLTAADLSDKSLKDFGEKKKILNIVVSLDTGVCALSAERFNKEVSVLTNTVLINVSADLPFAQKRFCESHSLSNIITLSTMRAASFGEDYGVRIASGPLSGLLGRAVVVLDGGNKVIHAELVPEITHEPDYEAALQATRSIPAPGKSP